MMSPEEREKWEQWVQAQDELDREVLIYERFWMDIEEQAGQMIFGGGPSKGELIGLMGNPPKTPRVPLKKGCEPVAMKAKVMKVIIETEALLVQQRVCELATKLMDRLETVL